MSTEASIASPHWEACKSCVNNGDNGCKLSFIDLGVYLGDFIICLDYKTPDPLQDEVEGEIREHE